MKKTIINKLVCDFCKKESKYTVEFLNAFILCGFCIATEAENQYKKVALLERDLREASAVMEEQRKQYGELLVIYEEQIKENQNLLEKEKAS